MSITIKRNIGWNASGSRAVIKLNGKKVAKVSEKQQIKIDIPKGNAKLKISLMGVKSGELEVKDGETIEIIPTKWYKSLSKMILIFSPLSVFVSGLLPNVRNTIFVIIPWVILFISLFLIEGFHLNILEDEH